MIDRINNASQRYLGITNQNKPQTKQFKGGYIMISDQLRRLKIKGWVLALWAVICAMLFMAADPLPSKAIGVSPAGAAQSTAQPSFLEFESGQVRPLAMSPDRTRLFAINTPDNTLEIFGITSGGLALQARVPVGLEPVAVA